MKMVNVVVVNGAAPEVSDGAASPAVDVRSAGGRAQAHRSHLDNAYHVHSREFAITGSNVLVRVHLFCVHSSLSSLTIPELIDSDSE
jgi:hypothetical protein